MKAEERIRRNRIRRQAAAQTAACLSLQQLFSLPCPWRAEASSSERRTLPPDVVYQYYTASASGREIPCGQSRTGTRTDILNRNRISSRR